jgi:hypothetical protein
MPARAWVGFNKFRILHFRKTGSPGAPLADPLFPTEFHAFVADGYAIQSRKIVQDLIVPDRQNNCSGLALSAFMR